MGDQSGLRFWPACRGPRCTAYHAWRRIDRRCRRAGKHVAFPHAAAMRQGQKMGDVKYIDTMIRDGLWDASTDITWAKPLKMLRRNGRSAVMRRMSSLSAARTGEAAQKAGKFVDEITQSLFRTGKGTSSSPRMSTFATVPRLRHAEIASGLREGWDRDRSNASGLNDGAAATLLMSAAEAEKRGIKPLGRIASYATAGLDRRSWVSARSTPRARRWIKRAGRSKTSISWKPTKPLPPRLRRQQGHGLGS